jgi:hypothetical protein
MIPDPHLTVAENHMHLLLSERRTVPPIQVYEERDLEIDLHTRPRQTVLQKSSRVEQSTAEQLVELTSIQVLTPRTSVLQAGISRSILRDDVP